MILDSEFKISESTESIIIKIFILPSSSNFHQN